MTRRTYTAGPAEVTYDAEVCIHAAECVRGLPKVFDPEARPWIQPANATPEQIEKVVATCPSGALAFRRLGAATPAATASSAPAATSVVARATRDGPVVVAGPIVVEDSEGKVLRRADQVAFCRCGHSATKPFCDGAHTRSGFKAD